MSDAPAVTEQSLSLWDLARQLVELIEFRETQELTSEEIAAVDAEIERYVQAEVGKVDKVRGYLLHCDMMACAARDEANRQAERARIWENRHDRLLAYVKSAMEAQQAKSLEGRTGKFILKGNGGRQALEIADEAAIPDRYKRTEIVITIDRERVYQDLCAGEAIAGARLLPRGKHVEVK